MSQLPVQPARIHCPPPRDDTLSRERLNSWLERAASGRLGLIVAEAGFGKTTLLADWAMHTARMTAWYRLEPDDRDWLTFIRHIVASGREIDPEFAPDTFRLLHELETGGTNQHELTASLAREVSAFGIGSARGLTLILDDYHVVDGFAETDPIVRALLDRTAPGFSMVIATRANPRFSMGRLRARGGVMTLEGPDLCFDVDETSRLFRDAYHRPLDEDIVSDLVDRTEGWAALLTLVRTGLDEPGATDPRALVAQLDTSHGDLYDFLAEEMLATRAPELQHFLPRVALLTAVDVSAAMLVDDRPADEVAASIAESERLGLLTRPDRQSAHRFHPLVREFLEAHLTAEVGREAVRDLHRVVAMATESTDWYAAAWHFRAADDPASAARVIDGAIPTVVASGQIESARWFLDGSAGSADRTGALILRSRLEMERGDLPHALRLAERAAKSAEGTSLAGVSLLNLTSTRARHGFAEDAVELAAQAMLGELTDAERQVAEASMIVSATQEEGSLAAVADFLAELARRQDQAGHVRYAGVTRVNLAVVLLWQGRNRDAAVVAARAEIDLDFAPGSAERVAASAARVAALVQVGQVGELDRLVSMIESGLTPLGRDEAAIEAARLLVDYGSNEAAETVAGLVAESARAAGYSAGYLGAWAALMSQLSLRRGDARGAAEYLALTRGRLQDAAGKFRLEVLATRIALSSGSPDAAARLSELERIAVAQESRFEELIAALLRAAHQERMDTAIARLMPDERHTLSTLAEEVCRCLPALNASNREIVRQEATLRPERWASALRFAFATEPAAAELLAEIGGPSDAEAMRSAASSRKWLRPVAARMTRRLAPRLQIGDLGSVAITIGEGQTRVLRRKVLALLCFVSSRPGMAVTRDEALDAVWPDLGPDTAVNSLHQTIYYLRRVIEPAYREGLSAGYVAFDGEVLSLDRELVDTHSRRCWRLISLGRGGDPRASRELLGIYRGTYALDFAYEEWAIAYRENLHAAVLAAVEASVRSAINSGDANLAIELAQRLLAVDSAADSIELELLRAYKLGGRHAAAAEQYAHYASYVRGELGAEPPPFDDI
ncbi:MAG TPA: BTAD domain-containing putative transcriptional regulator [Candidatus Limnocylindrales bacterium]|nr:BTAD domain-containing putative transcriptional regulator [Candidatus Limnocylindrales bacterium]